MGEETEEQRFYTKDVHIHSSTNKVAEEDGIQNAVVDDGTREQEAKDLSVEELFASTEVPPWWKQITVRGLGVSLVLGVLFCVITLKLSLTTGVIPSLNVSAGLLGFFLTKSFTSVLAKLGIAHQHFTRQENTVIQTCVVACYGLAFSGGFGTYLTGMDQRSYNIINASGSNNLDSPNDVKNPRLNWIISYMFVVGFLGLFAVVPLRKIMVIDYKLTYPSGTATAVLINSFHTPHGSSRAMKQIKCLGKYFTFSFLFSFFKWFFSGEGDSCGFDVFPSLGLTAYANKFYFDFSMTYVGAGMICPHLINVSLLLGGILSWGFMWPLIAKREGDWYPSGLKGTDLRGLYGYKVFVAIAIILGDGLYNFVKITFITLWSLYKRSSSRLPMSKDDLSEKLPPDEKQRNVMFMKDSIPFSAAAVGYIGLAAISTGVIPQIFPQMRWYYVFLSYCVAPVLGFCNAYSCGLTDWNLASTYGKLGLFIFAAWAGRDSGVLVGLISCGVMMIIVACSADLMQDFKTGYLTLSSPRSMFTSQILGTAMGCVIAPLMFWLFWKAFPIGDPHGEYAAPYATIYRAMATIGVQGFSALPKHCMDLCYGFFFLAMLVNFLRDKPLARWAKYIPIPMAMAIPFYIGPYFAIDMFVGTVIVFAWQKNNKKKAEMLVPAVASGLICGDGIWTLIAAILALAKKNAPICMMFLSSKQAAALST